MLRRVLIALSLAPLAMMSPGSFVGNQSDDSLVAMKVADAYLEAWANRDVGSAVRLLSDSVKSQFKKDDLDLQLSGLSNPHHSAYELLEGRPGAGEAVFYIRLYEFYMGTKAESPTPVWQELRLRKDGKGDWKVSALPSVEANGPGLPPHSGGTRSVPVVAAADAVLKSWRTGATITKNSVKGSDFGTVQIDESCLEFLNQANGTKRAYGLATYRNLPGGQEVGVKLTYLDRSGKARTIALKWTCKSDGHGVVSVAMARR